MATRQRQTNAAVRRDDARTWPCPWIEPDLSGCSSRPIPWPLSEAKAFVDHARTSDHPYAVFRVRGAIQQRIYPPSIKEGSDGN